MQVVIGIVAGVVIAALAGINNGPKYLTGDNITAAPVITFLWVHTFPLGFYAPALLPFLLGFVVTVVENIGDVTATAEASNLDVTVRMLAVLASRLLLCLRCSTAAMALHQLGSPLS